MVSDKLPPIWSLHGLGTDPEHRISDPAHCPVALQRKACTRLAGPPASGSVPPGGSGFKHSLGLAADQYLPLPADAEYLGGPDSFHRSEKNALGSGELPPAWRRGSPSM